MGKRTIREAQREKKRRRKRRNQLIWSGIAIVVLALAGFIGWSAIRPSAGEQIPIMANAGQHVAIGSDPGPYNSNPPTSGQHYGQELDAGFYDENSPQAQVDYPEGYLGHNLEHGYVIFWYNCDLLDEAGCETLKTQIQGVMDKFYGLKLIAFPSASLDAPLVMASWGQLQRFETFDEKLAEKFVSVNRNRAPEPNAP
ncbi:MAG: DUF3105 domain-containing protein [Anaerolineales bacterium]|nr:DUF3105 domain-containing protein [Anaerolineales bacterium]